MNTIKNFYEKIKDSKVACGKQNKTNLRIKNFLKNGRKRKFRIESND